MRWLLNQWKNVGKKEKNQILNYKRKKLAKYTDPDEIKTVDLLIEKQIKTYNSLVENEIKRFSIIKEEEKVREIMIRKMREETEIIPVESLGKLPDIEVLDSEYMMLQNQYTFRIQ